MLCAKQKILCEEKLRKKAYCSVIIGFLSSQHGASSACGEMIGLQNRSVAASVQYKLSQRADRGWYYR